MAVYRLNESKSKTVRARQSSEHTPGIAEDGSRVYYGYINIEHPTLGDFYVSVSVTGFVGEVRTDGKPWGFKLTPEQINWVNAHKKELAQMAYNGDDVEYLTEDTVRKSNGKWTNRGDDGTEHGEFETKKQADAQRKAMYANGYKGESLKEDVDWSVDDEWVPDEDDWEEYGDPYRFHYDPESLEESSFTDMKDTCQQWVDHDIEQYGYVTRRTKKDLKKAGFNVYDDDKFGYYVVPFYNKNGHLACAVESLNED